LFFHPPTPPVGGHDKFSKERFSKEQPRPGKCDLVKLVLKNLVPHKIDFPTTFLFLHPSFAVDICELFAGLLSVFVQDLGFSNTQFLQKINSCRICKKTQCTKYLERCGGIFLIFHEIKYNTT
jgi:hypothetical protein